MDGQSRERALGPAGGVGNFDLTIGREELKIGDNSPPNWLLQDHFKELTANLGMEHVLVRPEPDWGYYMKEQSLGNLIYVVARDWTKAEQIVGYMVLSLSWHPHYRTIRVASDDLHYLTPFWRGSGYGGKLLDVAEEEAWKAGVSLFLMRTRIGVTQDEHDHIYRKRGYVPFDVTYVKDLSHGDQKSAA